MIDLDLLVILDRSGSMQARRKDHEGGVQAFVEDQKNAPGDARFTLVQFDSIQPCEIVYDRAKLADVGPILLVPRGSTPLLDAVGLSIAHLRKVQKAEPAGQTVIVVVTDGEENSSAEWTLKEVKTLIGEVEASGAKVLFLGATLASFTEAAAMGVTFNQTVVVPQHASNIAHAYQITSEKLLRSRQARAAGATGQSVNSVLDYTDEDRAVISKE